MKTDVEDAADDRPVPASPVRLDYADRHDRRVSSDLPNQVTGLISVLGGGRQCGFALGMGFLMAGIGLSLPEGSDGTALFMGVGGLLIGFAVPVQRWWRS